VPVSGRVRLAAPGGPQQSAAPAYPPTPAGWYVVAILFGAAMISYTDRLILNLLVDPIRRDLQLTDVQISYLQGAAFAIIYAIIALPMGNFADRHSRRKLLLFGISTWSLATAACGFAASFKDLFLLRLCVGIGEAALAPAAMSLIPDYFPPQRRGTAIGVFLLGIQCGAGAANLIGGLLIAGFASGRFAGIPLLGHLEPWRAVLVSLGIAGVAVGALLFTVREPARQDTIATTLGRTQREHLRIVISYLKRNRWTFVLLVAAFCLDNVRGYGTDSWMPSVLVRDFGLPASRAGTLLGYTSLICGMLGAPLGGLLCDRLAKRRVDAGVYLALVATFLEFLFIAFPLAGTPSLVLLGYGLYNVLVSLAAISGLTAIQNAAPSEMRGMVVAIQASLFTLLGLGLGPTLVAGVTELLFRSPRMVNVAIVTVSVPIVALMAAALRLSLPHYRATRARMAIGG
jgi:MFS family permease